MVIVGGSYGARFHCKAQTIATAKSIHGKDADEICHRCRHHKAGELITATSIGNTIVSDMYQNIAACSRIISQAIKAWRCMVRTS